MATYTIAETNPQCMNRGQNQILQLNVVEQPITMVSASGIENVPLVTQSGLENISLAPHGGGIENLTMIPATDYAGTGIMTHQFSGSIRNVNNPTDGQIAMVSGTMVDPSMVIIQQRADTSTIETSSGIVIRESTGSPGNTKKYETVSML